MLVSAEVNVSTCPLWLPAFTTGRSKKENKSKIKDNGKYTFRTINGFSWIIERCRGENIMLFNNLQEDDKKILRN